MIRMIQGEKKVQTHLPFLGLQKLRNFLKNVRVGDTLARVVETRRVYEHRGATGLFIHVTSRLDIGCLGLGIMADVNALIVGKKIDELYVCDVNLHAIKHWNAYR